MSRRGAADRAGVLLATDVFPPECGGSGWSVHALARCLRARGHPVEILELDPGRDELAERTFDEFRVRTVGTGRQRRSPRARLGGPDYATARVRAAVAALLRERRELRIVHAQHLHSGPGAVAAARAAGRASVLTLRDYWPVCLHSTTWWGGAPCPGCTVASLAGCMQSQYGWPYALGLAMVPWARRRLAARARGVAAADAVVAVSEALRGRLAVFGAGYPIEVIPNVVSSEELERVATPFEQLARAYDLGVRRHGYLLFAGKLTPEKGPDLLLEALARIERPPPLLFAGTGPLEPTLRTRAAEAGLTARFLGWLPRAHLAGLIRAAAAVALPSRWGEPLSRVLLEALALATPVIAWPEPSSAAVLAQGGGWIVDGAGALRQALAALREPERRRQVGEAGRALAHARFAPEVVYPQWAALYARLLGERRHG